MYLIQDQHRTSEPQASEFYAHPYGGVARDIRVSREGFIRLFDDVEKWLIGHEKLESYGKVVDEFPSAHVEIIGYLGHKRGVFTYGITFIDRSVNAAAKFVQQETDKLLKNYGKLEKVS